MDREQSTSQSNREPVDYHEGYGGILFIYFPLIVTIIRNIATTDIVAGNGKFYLRVHIHSHFGHARSRTQPLAWPVSLSAACIVATVGLSRVGLPGFL